jgi:hypothetical protein
MELSNIGSICMFGDSIVYAHTDPARGRAHNARRGFLPGRLIHFSNGVQRERDGA